MLLKYTQVGYIKTYVKNITFTYYGVKRAYLSPCMRDKGGVKDD